MSFSHIPVLLHEVISLLPPGAKTIIDLTLGGGNHAFELLSQRPDIKLHGVDRDLEAIEAGKHKLKEFSNRVAFFQGSFSSAIGFFRENSIKADFILADLGVSSHQLDSADRGFSFRTNGPLDMRMDSTQSITAADVVNQYPEYEIFTLIKRHGEERFAKQIAKKIIQRRLEKPFKETKELVETIEQSIPKKFHFGKIHPATKTFQAIRIEVNKEIEELQILLDNALELLAKKGRLAIISFHSLEDRPVKQQFKKWESPCTCPKEFPICTCGLTPLVKILTKKAVVATITEKKVNMRSRSAKLRAIEKL